MRLRTKILSTTVGAIGGVMDIIALLSLYKKIPADIGIFPDIGINWPIVMILVGTGLITWPIAALGFYLFENSSRKRFMKLYSELVHIRSELDSLYDSGLVDNVAVIQLVSEIAIVLKSTYKITPPNEISKWRGFVHMLVPLSRTGNLELSRKLHEATSVRARTDR